MPPLLSWSPATDLRGSDLARKRLLDSALVNPVQTYRDKGTGRVGKYDPEFARIFPQLELVENGAFDAPLAPEVEPDPTPATVAPTNSDKKES